MRENPDEFKAFIVVNPGGGSRRNPKRKNAGGHSASFTSAGPSPHDVEATFQSYLKTMAKGGAYGDNLEITAFAFAFKVDVKIYSEQGGYFYVASGAQNTAEDLPTLYIVHHVSTLPCQNVTPANLPHRPTNTTPQFATLADLTPAFPVSKNSNHLPKLKLN